MTCAVENIYLRGLREIMGELGYIRRDLEDIKASLSGIEAGMGKIKSMFASEPAEPFTGPKS